MIKDAERMEGNVRSVLYVLFQHYQIIPVVFNMVVAVGIHISSCLHCMHLHYLCCHVNNVPIHAIW